MTDRPATPSAEQLRLMEHATGWPRDYRNYYAANPASPPAAQWDAMITTGLAELGELINTHTPRPLRIYHVTNAGKAALRLATQNRREP